MPTLDIFNTDPFTLRSLTDAINKLPFVPGRAGQLIDWNEGGVTTTGIMLEEVNGVLTIVNPTARGGVGSNVAQQKRILRTLNIPHYERNDSVYAEEVQGVREFGQEQAVRTVQSLLNSKMGVHAADFDTTLEYQRVGATKGIILNGDGTTLYNLFTEMGVTQPTEIAWDLTNGSPANGAVRKQAAHTVRAVEDALGGTPISGVHAYCGDSFFDDLLSNTEVTKSYLNTPMAEVLRQGYVYPNGDRVYGAFEFGGIVWENYRGSVGATKFIDVDHAYFFPVGPTIFKTVFAPADYMETVNTVGQPRYAKQYPMQNDKGVNLEMQMNALSYCTRPAALQSGRRGS
jgi:Phage major capsid protein E